MDRNTFNYGPGQGGTVLIARLDQSFMGCDGLARPSLPNWNIMEGRDNIGRAGLSNICQANGVIGTKPSPRFAHNIVLTVLKTKSR